MVRCVDNLGRVVPDSFCDQQQVRSSYVTIYHPYYGGYGSYNIGSTVSGGGFSAVSGETYSTSTSRGGFGSSFGGGGRSGGSGSGGGS
jgi:hypothetical protein